MPEEKEAQQCKQVTASETTSWLETIWQVVKTYFTLEIEMGREARKTATIECPWALKGTRHKR